MGFKDDIDVAQYSLPLSVTFSYDGANVSDPQIQLNLYNAAGHLIQGLSAELTLTPTQKTQLKNALDARLATFESNTGWTLLEE